MSIVVDDTVAAHTRRRLERVVIGLNLCPFARAPHVRGQIRFAVSDARDIDTLATGLRDELEQLHAADPDVVETTLAIHPHVLHDFLDYNDFLETADALLEDPELDGEMQIASFHPDDRFADAAPDAIENHSNRSPHPILHLLREDSIARVVDAVPDTDAIYQRNITPLRGLRHAGWNALWNDDLRFGARPAVAVGRAAAHRCAAVAGRRAERSVR